MEATSPPDVLVLDTCEVHLQERKVITNGSSAKLSPKEAELLVYLWTRRGETVTREELFTAVWGYSPNAVSRAVDATLLRLRKKIEGNPSEPVHLFSLYGLGYRFVLPEVTKKPKTSDLFADFSEMPTPTPPSAPSRRFGTVGSKKIGGNVTGEMLGRDRELNDLVDHLLQGQRILTLTGPGGMGKTRMAQEIGRKLLNTQDIEGGVWFVDLALATQANDILQTVSDTLNIPLQESGDPTRTSRRLGRAMTSRKRFLLILDNFEQLVQYGPITVQLWSEIAKEGIFLVTSRQALGIENEKVFDLAPLNQTDAIALFVERAQAVKPTFTLQSNEKPIIEDIVEQLDRIPLAIRLAAGRSRLMSVTQIQKRLSERFKLLRRGPGLSSDRQATMEAAIDWSWNLLSDLERSVLHQCAVFRCGFTLEAAQAIIQYEPEEDPSGLREVLDTLASKSLLFSDTRANNSERLNTYDSVRYYALERIDEDALFIAARERHVAYFLAFGDELLATMKTYQAHEAFRILKLEIDNLQAVFDHVLRVDSSLAFRAFIVCETLYSKLDWHQSSLDMMEDLLKYDSGLDLESLLVIQSHRALALHGLARLEEARESLEWVRAKTDPVQHRNRWVRASVHDSLLLSRQGKYDEAGTRLETLLADPNHQTPDLRADILAGLGFVRRGQQRYLETLNHWREAIDIGRGHLRHFWIEQTENNLAAMQVQCGDLDTGRIAFETNLKRVRGLTYPQEVGLQLYNLAHIELIKGHLESAGLYAQEATALIRNGVTPLYRGISCIQLAVIHHLTDHPKSAIALLTEAKEQCQSVQQMKWVAHAQSLEAAFLAYLGQFDLAQTLWDQSKTGILELYPLTEDEIDTIWDCHLDLARGETSQRVDALVSKPGVLIPRKLGQFTPDPKRRGNPDHQPHILLLDYKTHLSGRG